MSNKTYQPAWWLPSPHLQTLWPVLFRRHASIDLIKERVELSDGDFIDLCWGRQHERPIALILHGLEGSVNSHYAMGLMSRLEREGYCPVLMHFRGCSGEPNRLARSYHSGDTADMSEVVEHIMTTTGQRVFAAIGFSLGGNALLKWLGQSGSSNPLQRAVAISVPFRLAEAAKRLEKGLSHLYERHLMSSLKQSYLDKFSNMESPIHVDVSRLKGFWDFDDQVTAPLHGFDGVDHYYRESSCRQYLSSIRVPTRIIHALDDPFMFPETAPGKDELSSVVDLQLVNRGGHVGFVSGKIPWKPVYWHEQMIIDFLHSK